MADDKQALDKLAAAAEAPKPAEAADPKKGAGKPKMGVPVLQPREKTVFQIFLFMLSLLVVDLAIIHPIGNYLQKLDETIKAKEDIIPKRLLILKHKTNILNEYRGAKPFFVAPSVSQEEETAQFLREIEKVSKEVGFSVSNINPVKVNKKSESDSVYELSLDVEGRGGLKEVRNFMRTVERSNPSICVAAFTLKPQSKDSDELKVLFSIIKLGVKKNHPTLLV